MTGWLAFLGLWSLGEIGLAVFLLTRRGRAPQWFRWDDPEREQEACRALGLLSFEAGVVGLSVVSTLGWMQDFVPKPWLVLVTGMGVLGPTGIGVLAGLRSTRELLREPRELWARRQFDIALVGGLAMASVVLASLALPLIAGAIPPNPVYGYRTAQTLADATVWYAVNRRGGWSMLMAEGAALASLGWLWRRRHRLSWTQMGTGAFLAFVLPLVLASVVSMVYKALFPGSRP